MSLLSLFFIFTFSLLSITQSQPPPPKGIFIDCGATVGSTTEGREWLPDTNYVFAGIPKVIMTPDLLHILSTIRSFPLSRSKKFCYVVPVSRTGKYLVRTTYYYGGINGGDSPPVFDQTVDGTLWSVVNTTMDYAEGNSSYYEGVFVARGKTMSLCLAANVYTESDPFISALEFVPLANSLYNSTDFSKYGLSLAARHSFGYSGPIMRFPDDDFDRFWQPFGDSIATIRSVTDVPVSGFWNLPPSKIFETGLMSDQPEPIELQWPPIPLPPSNYCIALYFADNRNSSLSSRAFHISINDVTYYQNLTVTQAGAAVFATQWPLDGLTKITLVPASQSDVGPLINGGEVFTVVTLGGRTLTRDVTALQRVKKSLRNPPVDWNGDPCLPINYPWTGVTCSYGNRIRVVSLNLTSMDLSGSLSPNIANLTALTNIWLGNNSLVGPIPDLSSLKQLQTLHLENNGFSGVIPLSVGEIGSLREIFLQNNDLTGPVPDNLLRKPGLIIRITPGNNLSMPPPGPPPS